MWSVALLFSEYLLVLLHGQTAVLVRKKATVFSVGFVVVYVTFALLQAKPLLWAPLFTAGQGQVFCQLPSTAVLS